MDDTYGYFIYIYTGFGDDAPRCYCWYPTIEKTLDAADAMENELEADEWVGIHQKGVLIGSPQELRFEQEVRSLCE